MVKRWKKCTACLLLWSTHLQEKFLTQKRLKNGLAVYQALPSLGVIYKLIILDSLILFLSVISMLDSYTIYFFLEFNDFRT